MEETEFRNGPEEMYERVADYDPVLRSHCRLRKDEPAEAEGDGRSIDPEA